MSQAIPFPTLPQLTDVQAVAGLNVKSFGARGDGTTDDTTAIQSAITAAQTGNGVLNLPAGDYVVTPGVLTISNSLRLSGAGRRWTRLFASRACAAGESLLSVSTAHAPLIVPGTPGVTDDLNSPHVSIRDLAFINKVDASPTQGFGVSVTDTVWVNWGFEIEHCWLEGFFYNLHLNRCLMARVRQNFIWQHVRAGVCITNDYDNDQGDNLIADNLICSTPDRTGRAIDCSGIFQTSGAGLYVRGNKILNNVHGVYLYESQADAIGPAGPGSVMVIQSNSIEQQDINNPLAAAVVLDSDWGRGSGPTNTNVRSKFSMVSIDHGHVANTRAVSIRALAGAVQTVKLSGNGENTYIEVKGAVANLLVTGCNFLKGGSTSDKPIDYAGTGVVTNGRNTGNNFVGYGTAPDLAAS